MKICVASDFHLDHVTEGQPRYDDIVKSLDKVLEVALKECGYFIFLGDICDPDRNLSVMRCCWQALRVATRLAMGNLSQIWLAGNHDVIEDGSGASTITPLRAMVEFADELADTPGMCIVCEEPRFISNYHFDCLALPFTANSHTYDPVKWVLEAKEKGLGKDRPFFILSHLAVEGIQPGEETAELPRGRDIILPHRLIAATFPDAIVLQGHYHKRQKFENVQVCGSLANLTFSAEGNRPGFLILEIPDAA